MSCATDARRLLALLKEWESEDPAYDRRIMAQLNPEPNDPMTNPTTEADSQTRTIRGVVEEVRREAAVNRRGHRYVHEISEGTPTTRTVILLDHPLTVGQTYEVEVTVREVE